MASNPLPNYLRAHRKRAALSQDDVAFLLGKRGGEKVCRHELFSHNPDLETLLAYAVIFQKPAEELFTGLFRQIRREVLVRVRVLAHKTKRQRPGPMRNRKMELLLALITKLSNKK